MSFHYLLALVLLLYALNYADSTDYNKRLAIIKEAQQYTCLIRILQDTNNVNVQIMQGAGVLIKYPTKNGKKYFCLTACHVISPLIGNDTIVANIGAKTTEGYDYFVSGKDVKLLWFDKDKDLAILTVAQKFDVQIGSKVEQRKDVKSLEYFAPVNKVQLGDKVLMLGYRWLFDFTYNYVLKEGMVASVIDNLPLLGGATVFYIDKMANKGMSGGLVFYENGAGLGIMQSYLYEAGNKNNVSDDLTIVIPMEYFLQTIKELKSKNKISDF